MIKELTQEPNVTFAYLETVDQQLGGLSDLEDCQQVSFLLATVQSLDMVYRKGSSGCAPKIAVVRRNRAGQGCQAGTRRQFAENRPLRFLQEWPVERRSDVALIRAFRSQMEAL